MKLNINMSQQNNEVDQKNEYKIENIVKDIESGNMEMKEIIKKYNLTSYKYYKIIKELEIKNESSSKRGPKGKTGPKNTKFKRMLYGSDKEQIDLEKTDEKFDKEGFIGDSKSGMKISELMEKYGLSLYQVRELRKRYELKTK
jgi:Mor family transcriptional regulator